MWSARNKFSNFYIEFFIYWCSLFIYNFGSGAVTVVKREKNENLFLSNCLISKGTFKYWENLLIVLDKEWMAAFDKTLDWLSLIHSKVPNEWKFIRVIVQ